jgi:bifunctional non-homologous end joining protein LigD
VAPDDRPVVGGVSISHPDRVVYADAKITKLDLAHFYERVGEWMLPHLVGRPLTFVRCPAGVSGGCFFMKHGGGWTPAGLREAAIREKTKIGRYLVVDSVSAILSLVQVNVIEWHTWNATVDRVDVPDRIVFDLDPGPRVQWRKVMDAARLMRDALQSLDLQSFVKTTGGKGLHVVVPLRPSADWQPVFEFARDVAATIVRFDPSSYTTTFAKLGREDKILIDIMRNNRLNTSVAAFSTRARPGAPVSTPLAWEELNGRLRSGGQFTVRNLERRLRSLRQDPWAAYWKCRQRLPAGATKRVKELRP